MVCNTWKNRIYLPGLDSHTEQADEEIHNSWHTNSLTKASDEQIGARARICIQQWECEKLLNWSSNKQLHSKP